MKPEFSQRFSKNTQILNFLKIGPVRAELYRADSRRDGRTDRRTYMTKLIVAFRNFTNVLKNRSWQKWQVEFNSAWRRPYLPRCSSILYRVL